MKTKKNRLNQIFMTMFLAVLLTTGRVYAEGTEMPAVPGLENNAENRLEVETWMVNENYWYHPEPVFVIGFAEEEKLRLESWMVSEAQFAVPGVSVEEDQKLKMESWMVDRIFWKG